MHILIIDSNRVMAKHVKSFLNNYSPESNVDLAFNKQILINRLEKHKYDFIIADIMSILEPDAIIDELNKVNVPVILWTLAPPSGLLQCINKLHAGICITEKPTCCLESMKKALSPVLT